MELLIKLLATLGLIWLTTFSTLHHDILNKDLLITNRTKFIFYFISIGTLFGAMILIWGQ